MSSITFQKVSKKFGETTAVFETDFQINSGEFTVLVGPSGCGKTTILRLIAGLEDVTTGVIKIDGKDITWLSPKARKVAMVFQNYALYPHLTVYENLKYPLDLLKLSRQEKKTL